jgi:broad specificity phosphatase PhoE
MTLIWLARHAQVHNPMAVLYGRLPRIGLSPAGRLQARLLAEFLADRPLAAVYSSPLLRARQTARTIAAAHPGGLGVHVSKDLLEIRTSWQGQPLAKLDAVRWDLYTVPRSPSDESLHAIRDRMCHWVRQMLRRYPGAEVVGVSHGDPILVLVAELQGRLGDIASIRPSRYPPTGGVYRLEVDSAGHAQDVELVLPKPQTTDTDR